MKYISTKTKSIIRSINRTGFIHIFSSSAINQILSFLSVTILVRIIPKNEYGVFVYVNNIVSIFLLFSGLGMASAILQVCSENYKNAKNVALIFKFGAGFGLGVNILLCFTILIFSFFYPLKLHGAQKLLFLMSFIPLPVILFDLVATYLRIHRLNKQFSYINTLNTIILLISSIIGAVLWSTKGMVIVRYFGYLLLFFLAVYFFKFSIFSFREKGCLDKTIKKDLIHLSTLSMFNNATGHLIYILDIFMVGLLLPNESIIASYKIATIIPNALTFIPSALMIYFYPIFAEHRMDKAWVKKSYYQIIKYFSMFNFLLSILLIIFAPIIIRVLFGNQYTDSITNFRILSVGYFFSATFRKITGNILVTQRKLLFNFWLGIIESLLNVFGNVILIKLYGSIGAAISSLLVAMVSSLVGVLYFYWCVNIK